MAPSNVAKAITPAMSVRRLKRGVFRSLPELQAAINRFLEEKAAPAAARNRALPALPSSHGAYPSRETA